MYCSCMRGMYSSERMPSGKGLTSNRLIEHFKKHDGVEFVTMEQVCDEFKRKNAPPPEALMPAKAGAILEK